LVSPGPGSANIMTANLHLALNKWLQVSDYPKSSFSLFLDNLLNEQCYRYGGNPFGVLLDKIAELPNNTVTIRHVKEVTAIPGCHVLYVTGPLPKLSRESILTVSAHPDFARRGGMIEIQEDHGKIAMIINLRALDSARIKSSARLLNLAEVLQ
jgi:hypothetical protein